MADPASDRLVFGDRLPGMVDRDIAQDHRHGRGGQFDRGSPLPRRAPVDSQPDSRLVRGVDHRGFSVRDYPFREAAFFRGDGFGSRVVVGFRPVSPFFLDVRPVPRADLDRIGESDGGRLDSGASGDAHARIGLADRTSRRVDPRFGKRQTIDAARNGLLALDQSGSVGRFDPFPVTASHLGRGGILDAPRATAKPVMPLPRQWSQWLGRLGRAGLNLVYPPACVVCREAGPTTWPLCPKCLSAANRLADSRCERCCREYPSGGEGSFACANCAGRRFAFKHFATVYHADGVVRHCVHALKYQGTTALAPLLAAWASEAFDIPPLADCEFDGLVPVPLHPQRERKRGFNQSHLLAVHLSQMRQIPLRPLLVRPVDTPTQTRFNRRQRMENLRSAFAPAKNACINHRRLMLVDDIFTTGSTIDECARVLLDAGAESVCAVTVARG